MKGYCGRSKIYTKYSEVTAANVVDFLNETRPRHNINADSIRYLYKYTCGEQPIEERKKHIRPDIIDNVVINKALQIVSFKSSYLLSTPIVYVSRSDNAENAEEIRAFNDFVYLEGKAAKDKKLADDFHVGGTALRLTLPNDEYDGSNSPFSIISVDPTHGYVAYADDVQSAAVAGVVFNYDPDTGKTEYGVYTRSRYFNVVDDGTAEWAVSEKPNIIGRIPLTEYIGNNFRLGAFEPVLDPLNAISLLESNRIEATEQTIQSLVWINNVELDEEDRLKLQEKPSAFIFTKSCDNATAADIKNITTDLMQADQQVLANDLERKVLELCGMPVTGDGNTSDSSNNGAMIVRNGWQQAEAMAKATEDLWRQSDMEFLAVALKICEIKTGGKFKLKPQSLEGQFTRRNYEDIYAKANVLTLLLNNDKVHPSIAYAVCGLVPDPEAACALGLEWYKEQERKKAAELEKQQKGTGDDVA